MGREIMMKRKQWGYHETTTSAFARLSPGFSDLSELLEWMRENVGLTVDEHRGGAGCFAETLSKPGPFVESAKINAPAAFKGVAHNARGWPAEKNSAPPKKKTQGTPKAEKKTRAKKTIAKKQRK